MAGRLKCLQWSQVTKGKCSLEVYHGVDRSRANDRLENNRAVFHSDKRWRRWEVKSGGIFGLGCKCGCVLGYLWCSLKGQ